MQLAQIPAQGRVSAARIDIYVLVIVQVAGHLLGQRPSRLRLVAGGWRSKGHVRGHSTLWDIYMRQAKLRSGRPLPAARVGAASGGRTGEGRAYQSQHCRHAAWPRPGGPPSTTGERWQSAARQAISSARPTYVTGLAKLEPVTGVGALTWGRTILRGPLIITRRRWPCAARSAAGPGRPSRRTASAKPCSLWRGRLGGSVSAGSHRRVSPLRWTSIRRLCGRQ